MSKSLDFCKKRALDHTVSSYADRNWHEAQEMDILPFLDNILHGRRKYELHGKLNDGTDVSYNVNISVNPDSDFDYFTSSSFVSDGTLIFFQEAIDTSIRKIVSLSTYNKQLGPPQNGCTVNWTIGNIIHLNEYDGEWIPKDKPFLSERTTILIPLKVSYE